MYCPSLPYSELVHTSPSSYYSQIIAQISSYQKYPTVCLAYFTPDICHNYKIYKVIFLWSEILMPLFFLYPWIFSSAQRVKSLIYIHWIDLKDTTLTWYSRLPIHKLTHIFQNFSASVFFFQFLHASLRQNVHYVLHSYSVASLYLTESIFKGSSPCSDTWFVESLVIHFTSHPTCWE